MENLATAETLTKKAVDYFGKGLHAVLLYGSTLSARSKPTDLDIIFILTNRETAEDVRFFSHLCAQHNLDIDLQIISLPDIRADIFSHDTHGEFIIAFLKTAKTLYGTNPFLDIYPKYTDVVRSVLHKTQYYYFRAKKIQANIEQPTTLGDLSFHRKKILLMFSDFWYVYSGSIVMFDTQKSLHEISKVLLGKEFTKKEIDFLLGNTVGYDWESIFSIYNRVYVAITNTLQSHNTQESFFIEKLYCEKTSIGSDKVVIIASGCPSTYDESEIGSFLQIRGYDVITFHYSATGRSGGDSFIPPHEDIEKVLIYVRNLYTKVTVLANSYGGYGALTITKTYSHLYDSLILVSAPVSLTQVKDLETLPDYLATSHIGWYRFDKEAFRTYIQTAQLGIVYKPERTTMIYAKHDTQVLAKDVESFCEVNSIAKIAVTNKHLSLNRLSKENIDVLHNLL